MEFDKSRVYTAVNADELKIGSKCIFADDLNRLRKKVQQVEQYTSELIGIREDCELYRFRGTSDEQDEGHALAYLIKPPAEPKYKPFASSRSLTKAIGKHGDVVKKRKGLIDSDIVYMNDNEGTIILANVCDQFRLTSQELLDGYVFASDDTPCGELVED